VQDRFRTIDLNYFESVRCAAVIWASLRTPARHHTGAPLSFRSSSDVEESN